MKYSFALVAISLCLLCGCAPHVAVRQPPADGATIKLAEAADSVSHSLIELAEIEAKATPPFPGKTLPDPNTFGMEAIASVDWAGPIEPLLAKIALASHYRLKTIGKPPALPILVSIDAREAQIGTILRDADFQAGKKAHVVVKPKAKLIELQYAKA